MSKNRFYMYTEYIHFLAGMSVEDQALLFRVILQYEGGMEVEEMTPAVSAVFSMIRNRLDNNRDEYAKTCEARAEAGRKGGLAKASKSKQEIANHSKPKQTVADNDNENDKERELDSNESNCQTRPSDEFNRAVELWNTLSDVGINQVSRVNRESRRGRMLNARLKEYGYDSYEKAIERIRGSDFLQGKHNGRPWQATFDWFVAPSNFPKVLEGNYDDKASSPPREERWQ